MDTELYYLRELKQITKNYNREMLEQSKKNINKDYKV